MPDPTTTPCPACGADALRIEYRLRVKPIGTSSVAGAQMKVAAEDWPWLICDSCGIEAEGKVDADQARADVEAAADTALARSGRLTLDEVCERFDIDPADLASTDPLQSAIGKTLASTWSNDTSITLVFDDGEAIQIPRGTAGG